MSRRMYLFFFTCVMLLQTSVSAQSTQLNAQIINVPDFAIVRATPHPTAERIGRIPVADHIMVIGRTADNLWLQTELAGGLRGWIAGDFVNVQVDTLALPITDDTNFIGMQPHFSENVTQNVRAIYALGQQRGLRANVFAKVGDSITFSPHAFTPMGTGQFRLASFAYLRPTLNHFALGQAHSGNPFINESVAAAIGWTAPNVLNTRYTDDDLCYERETPLMCEYRLSLPSVALIMFGTNDVGILSPAAYEAAMRQIIEASIELGVIPVISTIPPRRDFETDVERFNAIVRDLTAEYLIPLWDYGAVMTLHQRTGFDVDGVHPSIPPLGIRGSADFRSGNLSYGYVLRNLTALQMLDAVRRAVSELDNLGTG